MSRKLAVAHLPEFAGMRICDTEFRDTRITAERLVEVELQGWRIRLAVPLVDPKVRFILPAAKEQRSTSSYLLPP